MLEGAPLWFVVAFCSIAFLVVVKFVLYRSQVFHIGGGRLILVQQRRRWGWGWGDSDGDARDSLNMQNPIMATAVVVEEA